MNNIYTCNYDDLTLLKLQLKKTIQLGRKTQQLNNKKHSLIPQEFEVSSINRTKIPPKKSGGLRKTRCHPCFLLVGWFFVF